MPSRANPFDRDSHAVEENVKWRVGQMDAHWDAGYHIRWFFLKIHHTLNERLPWWFYNFQKRKTSEWRAKHGTPYRYHPEFPRVKRADQCETNDTPCLYEANQQMLRDRIVDEEIVQVMKARLDRCMMVTPIDSRVEECGEYKRRAYTAMDLYDTKYGDLAYDSNAISVLQKQKHRLMRERDGTQVYPPYTVDTMGNMYEKIHPSQPVNKKFPINPFPLQGFTYNGKISKEKAKEQDEIARKWKYLDY